MALLPEAQRVTEQSIVKAVAATGMRATRWRPGGAQDHLKQRQKSQTVYTTLSGLFIVTGILIHTYMAVGFGDIKVFPPPLDNESLPWETFSNAVFELFKVYIETAETLPEKIAYGLAVGLGLRHVVAKAFYSLKRLRADMKSGLLRRRNS